MPHRASPRVRCLCWVPCAPNHQIIFFVIINNILTIAPRWGNVKTVKTANGARRRPHSEENCLKWGMFRPKSRQKDNSVYGSHSCTDGHVNYRRSDHAYCGGYSSSIFSLRMHYLKNWYRSHEVQRLYPLHIGVQNAEHRCVAIRPNFHILPQYQQLVCGDWSV